MPARIAGILGAWKRNPQTNKRKETNAMKINQTFNINQRVQVIQEDPSSCSFLHGATGTITEIKKPIYENRPLYVVTFDTPCWNGCKGFTPMETCAFPDSSLEPLN